MVTSRRRLVQGDRVSLPLITSISKTLGRCRGHDYACRSRRRCGAHDVVWPGRRCSANPSFAGDLSRCHPSSEECLHLAGPDPQGQAVGGQPLRRVMWPALWRRLRRST